MREHRSFFSATVIRRDPPPINAAHRTAAHIHHSPRSNADDHQHGRTAMKILVVDDSKAMRMIVLRALRQAGFGEATMIEAEDGVGGLEKVRSERPDLILSDWNMPNLSGIEFLRELRASGDATTFGFVTSESTPAMREQAIAAGAAFLIAKPFTPDSFEEILSGVC
jgi:two-component system chemotaxis response regulator CheY